MYGKGTWNRTKKTLNYLQNLRSRPVKQGNRVLSGQNFMDGDAYTSGFNDVIAGLHSDTGKWVGIGSTEMAGNTFSGKNLINANRLIAYSKSGAIVTVNWNFSNPFVASGDVYNRADGDLRKLTAPNGALRAQWTAQLDEVVKMMRHFKAQGVVVVWRPFQEMNGNWFWWGRRDEAAFGALWRDMVLYLRQKDAWQNVLWCYSPNNSDGGSPNVANYATYYPGATLADTIGVTNYRDDTIVPDYAWLAAQGKPLWITEGFRSIDKSTGSAADNTRILRAIRSKYPAICGVVAWHSWRTNDSWNRMALRHNNRATELLTDPWIINRDEIPAL